MSWIPIARLFPPRRAQAKRFEHGESSFRIGRAGSSAAQIALNTALSNRRTETKVSRSAVVRFWESASGFWVMKPDSGIHEPSALPFETAIPTTIIDFSRIEQRFVDADDLAIMARSKHCSACCRAALTMVLTSWGYPSTEQCLG